ncbi:hypothetical protein COMA2_100185 [Candidatus Nitrospira nitrificans]|uniref:Uncharacterized protein n=1 Tax=Candidatus Nitrospira nitrificans TaxID=1742973 RepID=A0A0S4L4C8_9BACT|nr:hypothetical protein COMA2_100185 [Candidatus Nitrospira nitrificans]
MTRGSPLSVQCREILSVLDLSPSRARRYNDIFVRGGTLTSDKEQGGSNGFFRYVSV